MLIANSLSTIPQSFPKDPSDSPADHKGKSLFTEVWGYAGKGIYATQNFAEAAGRTISAPHNKELIQFAKRLKLLGVFGIVAASRATYSSGAALIHHIKTGGNTEDIASKTISFTTSLSEAAQSSASWINTALICASVSPIKEIAAITSPLGLVVCSTRIISNSLNIKNNYRMLSDLQQEVLSKEPAVFSSNPEKVKGFSDSLQKFLLEKVGITQAELTAELEKIGKSTKATSPEDILKEKAKAIENLIKIKQGIAQKNTHPAALVELKELIALFEEKKTLSQSDIETIFKRLNSLESILKKKMASELGSILGNVFIIIGLCLAITGVGGFLSPLFLGIGYLLLLSFKIYESRIQPLSIKI